MQTHLFVTAAQQVMQAKAKNKPPLVSMAHLQTTTHIGATLKKLWHLPGLPERVPKLPTMLHHSTLHSAMLEDLEQVASRQAVGKLETVHSFVQVLLHVGGRLKNGSSRVKTACSASKAGKEAI